MEAFLTSETDTYTVLQLRNTEETAYERFASALPHYSEQTSYPQRSGSWENGWESLYEPDEIHIINDGAAEQSAALIFS